MSGINNFSDSLTERCIRYMKKQEKISWQTSATSLNWTENKKSPATCTVIGLTLTQEETIPIDVTYCYKFRWM